MLAHAWKLAPALVFAKKGILAERLYQHLDAKNNVFLVINFDATTYFNHICRGAHTFIKELLDGSFVSDSNSIILYGHYS